MGVSQPKLEKLPLQKEKWQQNVIFAGQFTGPTSFDQLLLLKNNKSHRNFSLTLEYKGIVLPSE